MSLAIGYAYDFLGTSIVATDTILMFVKSPLNISGDSCIKRFVLTLKYVEEIHRSPSRCPSIRYAHSGPTKFKREALIFCWLAIWYDVGTFILQPSSFFGWEHSAPRDHEACVDYQR